MIFVPNKNNNDPTTLAQAPEYNSMAQELMNTVTGSGQTLQVIGGGNAQVSSAVATYAAVGDFYVTGGANVNNYVASPQTPFSAVPAYVNGMQFRVGIGISNTGASTVQIASLAALSVYKYDENGNPIDLEGGDLVGGAIATMVYIADTIPFFLLLNNGTPDIKPITNEYFYYHIATSYALAAAGLGNYNTLYYDTPISQSRPNMVNPSTGAFTVLYSGLYAISYTNIVSIYTNVVPSSGYAAQDMILYRNSAIYNYTAGDRYLYQFLSGNNDYIGGTSGSCYTYLNSGDIISLQTLVYYTSTGGSALFYTGPVRSCTFSMTLLSG